MPIQVGKALHPELDLGFQCDNTGDNISDKNGSYCELTALYWAWKNLPKDIEYVGLAHYRRYLDINDRIIDRIQEGLIVIPRIKALNTDLFTDISLYTSMEDACMLLNSILDIVPAKRDIVVDYFFNNNKLSQYNMFLMNCDDFNDYCTFVFKIIGAYEAISFTYPYTRQRRVVGYLSESLLGLWIKINNKSFLQRNVEGLKSSSFKDKIRNFQNDIAFKIYHFGRKSKNIFYPEPVKVGFKIDGINLDNL